MATVVETRAYTYSSVRMVKTDGTAIGRIQTEAHVLEAPSFFTKHLRRGDRIAQIGPQGFLVEPQGAKRRLLHAPIGNAAQPKQNKNGEWMVRAETANCSAGPRAIVIAGDALRRYFYQTSDSQTLYDILGCSPESTLNTLRIAWRVKNLELSASPVTSNPVVAERAFNLLAHPELRKCYHALLTDEDAAPIFPYGGFGLILVEGDLSQDGTAFFANAIIAFRPEVKLRKCSVLLRQCEFLADRIVCRDPRRRIEVSLDAGLLGGLQWDLTWNQWRQWLRSRIEVDAAFVQSGKYQFASGEWKLRKWLTALPSRLRVKLPDNLGEDVARARAIHHLLGEHADVVRRVREEIEKRPVEHSTVQRWFDELTGSPALKPQHVAWHADFDSYYFDQLRRRATTWYLFGREFLFVLPNVIVSEIPQAGHATYIFARPQSLDAFMRLYSVSARDDIRHNRANHASDLGFVGRVVRGKRKNRWLASVLKLSGFGAHEKLPAAARIEWTTGCAQC